MKFPDESKDSSDTESVEELNTSNLQEPDLKSIQSPVPVSISGSDGLLDEKSNKDDLNNSSTDQILEAVERTLEEVELMKNSVQSGGKVQSAETEDLEKWLDDILDD